LESPEEIKILAYHRIEEAKSLLTCHHPDAAFYLAGYAVELMLKWKICKLFGIDNLFSNNQKTISEIGNGVQDLRKMIKTHDLPALLLYSGLKSKFDIQKEGNMMLMKVNSHIMAKWNESIRYKPCGNIETSEVEDLLSLLQKENGFLKWIEEN
jgi:HEPN domain-containing protein